MTTPPHQPESLEDNAVDDLSSENAAHDDFISVATQIKVQSNFDNKTSEHTAKSDFDSKTLETAAQSDFSTSVSIENANDNQVSGRDVIAPSSVDVNDDSIHAHLPVQTQGVVNQLESVATTEIQAERLSENDITDYNEGFDDLGPDNDFPDHSPAPEQTSEPETSAILKSEATANLEIKNDFQDLETETNLVPHTSSEYSIRVLLPSVKQLNSPTATKSHEESLNQSQDSENLSVFDASLSNSANHSTSFDAIATAVLPVTEAGVNRSDVVSSVLVTKVSTVAEAVLNCSDDVIPVLVTNVSPVTEAVLNCSDDVSPLLVTNVSTVAEVVLNCSDVVIPVLVSNVSPVTEAVLNCSDVSPVLVTKVTTVTKADLNCSDVVSPVPVTNVSTVADPGLNHSDVRSVQVSEVLPVAEADPIPRDVVSPVRITNVILVTEAVLNCSDVGSVLVTDISSVTKEGLNHKDFGSPLVATDILPVTEPGLNGSDVSPVLVRDVPIVETGLNCSDVNLVLVADILPVTKGGLNLGDFESPVLAKDILPVQEPGLNGSDVGPVPEPSLNCSDVVSPSTTEEMPTHSHSEAATGSLYFAKSDVIQSDKSAKTLSTTEQNLEHSTDVIVTGDSHRAEGEENCSAVLENHLATASPGELISNTTTSNSDVVQKSSANLSETSHLATSQTGTENEDSRVPETVESSNLVPNMNEATSIALVEPTSLVPNNTVIIPITILSGTLKQLMFFFCFFKRWPS